MPKTIYLEKGIQSQLSGDMNPKWQSVDAKEEPSKKFNRELRLEDDELHAFDGVQFNPGALEEEVGYENLSRRICVSRGFEDDED